MVSAAMVGEFRCTLAIPSRAPRSGTRETTCSSAPCGDTSTLKSLLVSLEVPRSFAEGSWVAQGSQCFGRALTSAGGGQPSSGRRGVGSFQCEHTFLHLTASPKDRRESL
ncbi:hypothetical protein LIA77_08696 [Sarocladium implicatum]|nr:hypothetical protein LIA77_08696 [Sarocladium implicatum]